MEKYLTKEGLNRVWNNIKVWISSHYQEKIEGKSLSTNDYTTEEKTKLNSLSGNAQLPIGGTSGQILSKTSNTDYDVQWSDNSGGGNVEVIFDNSILELTSSSTQEEIINAFGSVDSFKNICTQVRNGNPVKLYVNFANTGSTIIPSYVHAATDNTTRWIIEIDAIYYDTADIAQMHIIIMYYNSLFTIEKTLSIVMPAGGTIGQVLTKASLSDFDTEWETPDITPTENSNRLITSGGVKTTTDAISTNIINNEKVLAASIANLTTRLNFLETCVRDGFGELTVDTLNIIRGINQYDSKGSAVIIGSGTPSVIPNYIGQFYVNTTSNIAYIAVATDNAACWKQINN